MITSNAQRLQFNELKNEHVDNLLSIIDSKMVEHNSLKKVREQIISNGLHPTDNSTEAIKAATTTYTEIMDVDKRIRMVMDEITHYFEILDKMKKIDLFG